MLPLSRLHQLNEESAQTWTALRELGVFGVSLPEEQGGSGLGATEEALIVLELGRRAVAASVLATIGAAHLGNLGNLGNLGTTEAPASTPCELPIGAGYRRGSRVILVADAHAQLFLIRTDSRALLSELPKATRLLDTQLWACRLLESAEPGPSGHGGRVLAEATPAQLLRLRLIDAAALAGVARAALDMAVSYAGMREQFGRPIGSFQAVKHHCANMALAARCAADQVSFAAIAVDDRREGAALQVESALYVAASAAIDNCGKNIQVHGGIGFSDEADPHLLLKRARVFVEIAGGLEAALQRIGAIPPATALTAERP